MLCNRSLRVEKLTVLVLQSPLTQSCVCFDTGINSSHDDLFEIPFVGVLYIHNPLHVHTKLPCNYFLGFEFLGVRLERFTRRDQMWMLNFGYAVVQHQQGCEGSQINVHTGCTIRGFFANLSL